METKKNAKVETAEKEGKGKNIVFLIVNKKRIMIFLKSILKF